MKTYFLLFLAILVVKQSESIGSGNVFNVINNIATSKSALDNKLKNFLEGFKEIMKHGNESIGIPPLDPFHLELLSLKINIEDFVGKFFTTSVTVQGLSDFIVTTATLKLVGLKLNIALEWPQIDGTIFNYTISDGRLMNFVNVFGHGTANLLMENPKFSIELSVAADKLTQFLSIKEVKTSISIGDNKETGKTELNIEGLYDDRELSQLFSSILFEFAPAAFNIYYEQIINTLNKFITDAGNKFLNGKTLKDLMQMMSS